MKRTIALAATVVAMGALELARPAEAHASALEGCPVVITVSYCPEDEESFCQAYACQTNISNCAYFGGALRVYCGTPTG